MKSFKYLIILVIFLKTGNVLSENTLFNVNNVEISGNLSSNNQSFSKKALEKGFKELINKVLLQKDLNKLKDLSTNQIKSLVSYYQISETIEDRSASTVIKKYNIFFDKEKIHDLFYEYEISYSNISQYEIYFLPIHKKNDKLYVYNKNYFYENWNKIGNNELIDFILPLEKIETLTNINNFKDDLLSLDIEDIFREYSQKNLALVLIDENNTNENKNFLKTNIMGKNVNKSLIFKKIEKKSANFYDDIIFEIKKEIINLVKSQNLIDIRTPSFINIKFFIDKKNNLVDLDKRIKNIDLIQSLYVLELNKKYVLLKIKYLGKINKIINQLKDQDILLKLNNDQWSLQII